MRAWVGFLLPISLERMGCADSALFRGAAARRADVPCPPARKPPRLIDVPLWARLRDGKRWHARHGPIDLILDVEGDEDAVQAALAAARGAFVTLLADLVQELPELRRVLDARPHRLQGDVARRMLRAVEPFREQQVTPMAAVAGAVADYMLDTLCAAAPLRRAAVNNGGDIALFLAPGESFCIALCGDVATGRESARITFGADDGIGGIATSGWRGRSHSLGIADAVTVLAPSAAAADAAATLIANAVDLPGSSSVRRQPASTLAPDSDLGEQAVTVGVEPLPQAFREAALARGVQLAEQFVAEGHGAAVRLELQSCVRFAGRERLIGDQGRAAPIRPGKMQVHWGQSWST